MSSHRSRPRLMFSRAAGGCRHAMAGALVASVLLASAPVSGQDSPAPVPVDGAASTVGDAQAMAVIDRYIEATGGAQAWAALTSIRGMGRIVMPGLPVSGRFTVEQTRTTYRLSVDMFQITPDGETHVAHQVTVRNGDRTWRQQGDGPPEPLNHVAHADLIRKQYFNPLSDVAARYASVTLEGTEDVDGMPCMKIAMVPKDTSAPTELRWFDVAEGLQRKIAETPRGGGVTAEVYLSDYRQVGTVKLHHAIRIASVGASIERIFDAMQTNVSIDACLFEPPAEAPAVQTSP